MRRHFTRASNAFKILDRTKLITVERSTQTIDKRSISLIAGVPEATRSVVTKLQEYDAELYVRYGEINRLCKRISRSGRNKETQRHLIRKVKQRLRICEVINDRRCFLTGNINAEVISRLSLLEVNGIELSDSELECSEISRPSVSMAETRSIIDNSITNNTLENTDSVQQSKPNIVSFNNNFVTEDECSISPTKRKEHSLSKIAKKKAKVVPEEIKLEMLIKSTNADNISFFSSDIENMNRPLNKEVNDNDNGRESTNLVMNKVITDVANTDLNACDTSVNASEEKKNDATLEQAALAERKRARALARLQSNLIICMNDYKQDSAVVKSVRSISGTRSTSTRSLTSSTRLRSRTRIINSNNNKKEVGTPLDTINTTPATLLCSKITTEFNNNTKNDYRIIGQSRKLFCSCRQPSFGRMILCDNIECAVKWYHFQCVGITDSPKGKWFCCNCRVESEDLKSSIYTPTRKRSGKSNSRSILGVGLFKDQKQSALSNVGLELIRNKMNNMNNQDNVKRD
ncbi:hypothetical protein GJ496_011895 [Pomphorhynchus laevis]|nr:hypothetical protein GJ496_011895 [Pomphorhynchus laevis]